MVHMIGIACISCMRLAAGNSLSSTKAEHEVQRGLLLDVVVLECAAVLELLTRKDQALLVRRDALLVLDLGLDSLDGVGALHLEGDGLAGQGLYENLHWLRVSPC